MKREQKLPQVVISILQKPPWLRTLGEIDYLINQFSNMQFFANIASNLNEGGLYDIIKYMKVKKAEAN